jgi:hypothetical protein
MDRQRLKKLQDDFNELAAQFKPQLTIVKRVREVIAEVDSSIQESQKRLQQIKQNLRT